MVKRFIGIFVILLVTVIPFTVNMNDKPVIGINGKGGIDQS